MTTDTVLEQVYEILNQNVNISIVIICLVVGAILKHAVKNFNNDWIPIALIVVGIILALIIELVSNGTIKDPIHVIIIGIASAAASVGIHQSGKTIYLYTKDAGSVDKEE